MASATQQTLQAFTHWLDEIVARGLIEREFFGSEAPRADVQGRTIHGLTVEQHLAHLRGGLLPMAERSGRVMRDALGALECLRAVPSEAVERSKPFSIALKL